MPVIIFQFIPSPFQFSSVQFSRSVVSNSLRPHESQHTRPPCPSPSLEVCPSSSPLHQWCHPTISSSVIPFSFHLSSIRVFSNESVLHIRCQSIGVSASASVLPMNIQDWFPLGWTDWISFQSKGLSRLFSNTTDSLVLSFLYSPTLTSIHDYWKNHSFNYMDLCRQSNVSAF